ncbi:MAG: 2-oxoglutarate dehydrogenase, E2 component, dihydrolipoamide succinyltransferase, partial [Nocardioides sp.]
MSTEVTLPALGESITEGTVTRWLKQVGDTVAVDEPLLEISTDKVDTEIPSPVAGTLLAIHVKEDDTVEVGGVLAVIGSLESTTVGPGPAETSPSAAGLATTSNVEEVPVPATPSAAAAAGSVAPGNAAGVSVALPALGESITEGTVTRWLKQVGDTVAVDEPLLEISTDKVDTEIPSPVAGVLISIAASEDETVAVGAELALIGPAASAGVPAPAAPPTVAPATPSLATPSPATPAPPVPAATATPPASAPPAAAPPTPAPTTPTPAPPIPTSPTPAPATMNAPAAATQSAGAGGATYVTPLVRKMAAQHGVDLASIAGSGVGGRIRKQDVLDAAEAAKAAQAAAVPVVAGSHARTPATAEPGSPTEPGSIAAVGSLAPTINPSPLRGTTAPLSRLRKVIAVRMVESLRVSAQLTSVVEVDVTAVARLRDAVKNEFTAREGVKLSFLPFFAKAAVDALKEHPTLNAAIDTDKGEVTYFDR